MYDLECVQCNVSLREYGVCKQTNHGTLVICEKCQKES